MVLGSCGNSNGVVGARLSVHGGESDGVLVPNIAGDALADLHRFTGFRGKESFASGLVGQTAEHLRISVRIIFTEDANRVDYGARFFRHFEHAVQTGMARVIAAVADDDQRFLISLAFLQAPQSLYDGVIKRGRAHRRGAPDRAPELIGAIAELRPARQAQRHVLVEVHHEHLVLGVAGPDERPGGGGYLAEFLPHAPTVVDDQADGDGRVFVPEQTNRLKSAVLVKLKIVLFEARNGLTRPVSYRGLQHHQVKLHGKTEK